jgi:hypothetical protein
LAKQANAPNEAREYRKLEQSLTMLADNEQWLADNHDNLANNLDKLDVMSVPQARRPVGALLYSRRAKIFSIPQCKLWR